jgi:hypothetical protein
MGHTFIIEIALSFTIGIIDEAEEDARHTYDEESARESEGEDPEEGQSPDATGESNLKNSSIKDAAEMTLIYTLSFRRGVR